MSQSRRERLFIGTSIFRHPIPKWVHVYDNNGKTADRYTVVFTGRYRKSHEEPVYIGGVKSSAVRTVRGQFIHLGSNSDPFHPQGYGQHGESNNQIDYPKYSHLGKKIHFVDLPEPVQRFVLDTYDDLWAKPSWAKPSMAKPSRALAKEAV